MVDEPKWQLFVRWRETSNAVAREHETLWQSHHSVDEAIRDACGLPPNSTAIRLQGPNGERFDQMEILKLCTEHRTRAQGVIK
jgi:hypothetical protein